MEPQSTSQENAPVQNPTQQTGQQSAPVADTAKHNVAMAVLAYIGPLIIVSYLVAKDDPFVKYHMRQGLVLLVIEVALSLLGSLVYMFWPIIQIINIVVLVLAIIGIINAVKGREKELPIVGKFASHFKF